MTRSGLNADGVVERRLAVDGEPHLVALHAQRALENLGDLLVVLDDEHARVASVHHPPKSSCVCERALSRHASRVVP